MQDNSQITNTIYKSKKISFETNNDDNRYVKTLEEIKQGELILIEHCYSTNNYNILANVIQNSPELFNNLYPRKINWDNSILDNPTDEIVNLCCEKALKNAFKINELFIIGLDISKFNNSSITPNATVKYHTYKIKPDLYCCILYVYSHNIININEEVTISYSNSYFGDNIKNESAKYKLENNYIKKIVEQYLKKDICINIIFNHLCISLGLYFIKDIICPTKRFFEYLTNTFYVKCNSENIKEYIKKMKINFLLEYKHLI